MWPLQSLNMSFLSLRSKLLTSPAANCLKLISTFPRFKGDLKQNLPSGNAFLKRCTDVLHGYDGNKHFHSFAINFEKSQYWDYSEKYGPNQWHHTWPCGLNQSPIDICTKTAIYDSSLDKFAIDRTPIRFNYLNNGVNASITPEENAVVYLQGGPLMSNKFQLAQYHFHFGEENTCGCEHTIDGHHFAAELHIVHFNRELYNDLGSAFSSEGGLAVLGIFLDASENYSDNAFVAEVLKSFDNIRYKGDEFQTVNNFCVYDMLPENSHNYFTYPGSLTTPPLTENVTWTVFKEPIKISKKQQKEFLKLYAVSEEEKDILVKHDPCIRSNGPSHYCPSICNNYREVQPLHKRIVRSSFL